MEGQRLIAEPSLRWSKDRNGWFAKAESDFSYTYYNLSDTAPGQSTQQRRALPLNSVEGGLNFERVTADGMLQTLQPHLFYLYVPYRNQDQLPVFDTSQPDFDLPELFARNRFTGEDRISDADQLTSAVTTRLVDPVSGVVKLSASLGEIYRLRAERVDLPGFTSPSAGSSDYIGSVDYQLSRRWTAAWLEEVTSNFNHFVRSEAEVRYREPGAGVNGRRFDLAYRYFDGLLEQADAAFSTPVTSSLRIAGRLRYSIQDDRVLESFAGLEYQTCCWAARATYHRYLTSNTGEFDNGVYFQLELKGLSKLGTGFDDLLPAIDPNAPIRGRGAASVVPY